MFHVPTPPPRPRPTALSLKGGPSPPRTDASSSMATAPPRSPGFARATPRDCGSIHHTAALFAETSTATSRSASAADTARSVTGSGGLILSSSCSTADPHGTRRYAYAHGDPLEWSGSTATVGDQASAPPLRLVTAAGLDPALTPCSMALFEPIDVDARFDLSGTFSPRRGQSATVTSASRHLALLQRSSRPSFVASGQAVVVQDEVTLTVNGYVLLQEIGRGVSGVVYVALVESTGELRAVKVISRARVGAHVGAAMSDTQLAEVRVMKRLRHEHIVTLHEFIDDPRHDKMYLVMDYVPDGPVAQLSPLGFCTPLPVDSVRQVATHVAAALAHLHRSGVVHGDVKPENILLDSEQGKAVLADFGVARAFRTTATDHADPSDATQRTGSTATAWRAPTPVCSDPGHGAAPCVVGTPFFWAPERFVAETPTMAADMWALGVTLYALLFGRLPFAGDTLLDVSRSVERPPPHVPSSPAAAALFAGHLEGLLSVDPGGRPTAFAFAASLATPRTDTPPSTTAVQPTVVVQPVPPPARSLDSPPSPSTRRADRPAPSLFVVM